MKRLIKKAMRDLFRDRRRALFSLTAILIGTMSFGITTFSYKIISRELVAVYDAINPASGSIMVDTVDDKLTALTDDFTEIASYEQKAYHNLRVQTGENEWKVLELFAAEDFSRLNINKITSEKGSFWPGSGEALIERDAAKVAGIGIGGRLMIALPDQSVKELTVTGIVADISRHPATAHDTVYAYLSYEGLRNLGLTGNKIDFIITGDPYDRERILTVSNNYIKLLEANGYTVSDLEVSDTPGVSMHLEEYESALFLLQIFSCVTLLFGGMIMSSLITSIVSAETRQIGILKGIGAGSGKITGAYLTAFFILIAGITVASTGLSTLLAGRVSAVLMGIGNMHPADTSVPWYFYALDLALSLTVPMAMAFFPIRRGISISVKDALNDYGLGVGEIGRSLPAPPFLSRPVLLSLRNAVHKKRRFILNAALLSVAGASFVAVITAMISIQNTLTANLDSWKFDYHYYTNQLYNENELADIMTKIPNVTVYENWGSSNGILVHDNGERTATYPILSPPDGSRMLAPDLLAGRWISGGNTKEIVVSHKFFLAEPDYQIGDRLKLQIGSAPVEFIIVGAIKDFGQTTVYMSEGDFEKYVPAENQLRNIKLKLAVTGRRRLVYQTTEAALKEQGVLILQSQSKTDLTAIAAGHYAVTLQTFLFVTWMLIIVAGFGLAAAMNVQTSERTKEIGIMKSMGATSKQIIRIITAESILIALTGWCGAVMLGTPLGFAGVYVFGNFILKTPLQFSISALLAANMIWFLLTIAVGYSASRSCARRAARISIRRSLEHT